jgi:hypothetical protein
VLLVLPACDTVRGLAERATSTGASSGSASDSADTGVVREVADEDPQGPEPKPISLSGRGKRVAKGLMLEKGVSVFTWKHTGTRNLIIVLKDKSGKPIEWLVNTIGSHAGSQAAPIPARAAHWLDVNADGTWSMSIKQPRVPKAEAPKATSFSGRGMKALGPFRMSEGVKTFEMSHVGDSNFVVSLLDRNGKNLEMLTNEIGDYDGKKTLGFPDAVYMFNIDADGEWTVDISSEDD